MKLFYKLRLSFFLFVAVFYANFLFSQQNHFIYIQSDDKQAFSVNVNGKEYNSSEVGYLIIPKLPSSDYILKITFPGNKYAQQVFNCSLNSADAGYALKNYGEKGWGLFNFQTLELVMAGSQASAEVKKEETPNNGFGQMLSDVVDDTTLKVDPVKKPEEMKKTDVANEKKTTEKIAQEKVDAGNTDLSAAVAVPVVAVPVAVNKTENKKENKKTGIKKLSEQMTADSYEIVFVEQKAGGFDTVRISIPLSANLVKENQAVKEIKADTVNIVPAKQESAPPVAEAQKESGKTEGGVKNPFFEPAVETAGAAATVPLTKQTETKKMESDVVKSESLANEQIAEKPLIKAGCKKMLSENDFDKVKHKMFSEANDNKMIEVAKKNFQGKCVTSDQVKGLGILFPSDEGRFNFFSAVYPFVADQEAYGKLKTNLIDPEYKKRFDQQFSK